MRTSAQTRQAIRALRKKEMGIKMIAKTLKISKNTVRNVLRSRVEAEATEPKRGGVHHLSLIRELFTECKGNAVRIRQKLSQEYGLEIAYSSLTRLIREAHLRQPKKRAGRYHFGPGEEMQHDTSPHRLNLDGKRVLAQCASLVLAYSRMIFIQYFPAFTRFEAKWFLSEALSFFQGSCSRCVVDNTSVVVAKGSGELAVFAPEVEAFAKTYGFQFLAHEVGDANRSARVERAFHYVENNFLAGRVFQDWQDLNAQARAWCTQVANAKPKRRLGMAPQEAFVTERPYLEELPALPPPIYEAVVRTVDNEGFARLDTNRYSVPERLLGKKVEIFKHPEHVEIFFNGKAVAKHSRVIGKRENRVTDPSHHAPRSRTQRRQPCLQETLLRDIDPILDRYLDELKPRLHGRGARAMQRLLHFKRLYPPAAFLKAINHAAQYGLYDLARLENLILEHVAGDFFQLQLDPGDCP